MQERKGIQTKPNTPFQNPALWSGFLSAIHRNLQIHESLNTVAEKVAQLFRAAGVEIYLLDELSRSLLLKAQRGLSPKFVGAGVIQPGEGLAGRVAGTGKSLFIDSLEQEKDIPWALFEKEGFSSYIGIPIVEGDVCCGVFGLYFKTFRPYSEEEKTILVETGRHLGLAVQNAKKYEHAIQKAQHLIGISRAITVTRQLGTLDRILEDISKMLVSILGFDLSWIALVSDDKKAIEGRAGFGAGMKQQILSPKFSIESGSSNPAVRIVKNQKPLMYRLVDNIPASDLKTWLLSLNVQSGGFFPVLSGDQVTGVIGVFYTSDQQFSEESVRLLTSVSEQTSIAIENAKLYEQIKTSEERYRTLFESTGTSMAIVDSLGTLRLVNRAFEELSGYSGKELIGKKTLIPFFLKKELAGSDSAEKLACPPQKWEEEFLDRKRDIKQVYVITAAIPHSKDTLVSFIDVTREQELEKRLFESQELASLGELSAGIAHEIRNPLIAINSSVSILKDERDLSPEGQQVLDVVKEETDHLAAIVNDFLKYARPKKLTLEKEDINRLLKDALKRYKDQCGDKIVWIEQYDETLPEVFIDRHQFQQVITNLLSNSLDAMPNGGKIFIQTNYNSDKKENAILISVKDTGSGIQPDILIKIFQPFFSTKEKGTGMGLAICRRIVNQHNGEIYVESETGKGALFTVSLPIDSNLTEHQE